MTPPINSWFNLLKTGTLEHLEESKDYLFESLDEPELEYMKLNLSFQSNSICYRMMRCVDGEEAEENKQVITSGLLSFINVSNFPDGIFLEITSDKTPIFHIIELKRFPPNQFEQISKQFLSAYLHCKTIESLLHLNTTAQFKYYIGFNEVVMNEKFPSIQSNVVYNQSNSPRFFPGQPLPESVVKWYQNNTISYYSTQYSHRFDFKEIINIPLPFVQNTTYGEIERKEFFSEYEVK
ncbi:hypothetical protein [Exiguobacterium sp. s91]|uniref:hypothetical protein n=1 Tax=Exiguobacterium sp. s91 TaxID=2751199 RepID=UPI001BE80F51|nr:hypothetical protein [Exiguobacterium sp. s91]